MDIKPEQRIVVALDVKTPKEALPLVELLSPHVGYFKIGLEFFTSLFTQLVLGEDEGPLLEEARRLFRMFRGRLMWDGKWDDIPNTVQNAMAGIGLMGPVFVNVHASAGSEAIRAVVAKREKSNVLGVTVLTSIKTEECVSIFGNDPNKKVVQFAHMILDAGAQGIICSAKELGVLAEDPDLKSLIKMTPGIRPSWAATQDQKRVMTPGEAIIAGADYLVIGRPITKPPAEIGTPVNAAKSIATEIDLALHSI